MKPIRTPTLLRIAAAVMVAEYAALFLSSPITPLRAFALGIGVLVAWFVLRGSRVAWILALLTAAAQLSNLIAMSQPVWTAITSAVILACLLVPSSRKYVWANKAGRQLTPWRAGVQQTYARCLDMGYGWAARLPGMGAAVEDEAAAKSPSRRRLVVLLVVWVLVFLPLVGALDKLHNGAARGNEIVDVLWHVLWIVWNLVLLALIALLVIAPTNAKRRRSGEL
jgi:hypothetical protein